MRTRDGRSKQEASVCQVLCRHHHHPHHVITDSVSVPTGSLTCGLTERAQFRGREEGSLHTHQHTLSPASTHLVISHTLCCGLRHTNPRVCSSCDLFLFPLRIPSDRHHGACRPRKEDHLSAEVSQQCHHHQ